MENTIALEIEIHASAEQVWDALTNPDKIEQYMFGARCESDWKPGSKADFTVQQDEQDVKVVKGEVIRSQPGQLLEHTILPVSKEIEDALENYIVAIYEIHPEGDQSCRLTITQKGFKYVENGMQRYIDSQKGWKVALPLLKEAAEQPL
jgi:uncharacterized protein YndB with AHSA1/START domain